MSIEDGDLNCAKIEESAKSKKETYDLDALLSSALRAICLTRDYVGGDAVLPAEKGWEWYDVGGLLADYLNDDEWAGEFRKRVNIYRSKDVRAVFKPGDWVFSIGENVGCSEVFEDTYCAYQPFSDLNDFDPKNYRLATEKEKAIYTRRDNNV